MPGPTFAAPPGFRDSPHPALKPGEVIASTYAIKHELARGETGVVYEARDMLLDRAVALKLAWRDAGTPSLIAEARRCALVRDPCAVQVHGMGTHMGSEFAVGERVTGRLLRDTLTGPLPTDVYLTRLRALVAAVARAHEAGLAVGEVSGATVLVASDERAPHAAVDRRERLVLGRLSLSQVPAFGQHGQILAPEIARSELDLGDRAVLEAIDLYALGCAAIELACGEPPFADPDFATELRAHVTEPPPRVADLRMDLPSELSDLVDWLLAKQPAGRPRSARDVLAQVDAIVERMVTGTKTVRVLIVEDDTARARWLQSLARRAGASVIVETASEGTDAGHKLNRDQPDLIFIDASLRGVMNALELCMYARGLDVANRGRLFLLGAVGDADRALVPEATVIPDDGALPGALLDRIRAAVAERPRMRKPRTTISG